MKCILCGSTDLKTVDTVVSDFVMARISPSFAAGKSENYKTKLCYCRHCTFAFYDYRFNEKEDNDLYRNYRDEDYQKTREKYECWYTARVNASLQKDSKRLRQQQEMIRSCMPSHMQQGVKVALDYGGNEGRTFYKELGTEEKYVFDISGVAPIDGVIGISDYEELKKHSFDFIMCNMLLEHVPAPAEILMKLKEIGKPETVYYIEVPNENPFVKGNKFSVFKNLSLLFNPTYNIFKLAKYYFQQRKGPFMPMKEHINFFTADSLKSFLEQNGFAILCLMEQKDILAVSFKLA